jgi:hypothetical protein
MEFLLTHPLHLFLLLVVLFISSNWWWAISLYTDAEKRRVRHKLLWSALALFTVGPVVSVVYESWTRRPQTSFSLTFTGAVAAGEKLEKIDRRTSWIVYIIAVVIIAFSVFRLIQSEQSDPLNLIIGGILGPLVVASYVFFGIRSRRRNQINPLDKPLWGMSITPEGNVDESLTRHKKTVVFLLLLIFLLPVFLALYIFIGSRIGY